MMTFILDFDHTISLNDIITQILDETGIHEWRDIENRADLGELTLRECLQWELDHINITKSEYIKFIENNLRIDYGAKELFEWIKNNDYPVYIVSDGLKEVIIYALNEIGANETPIFAHQLLWDGEKKIGIKMANDNCEHNCANCKISRVNTIKEKHPDNELIYIGDGFTDIQAAPLADIIFARNNYSLSKYLIKEGIVHHTYNTLLEIKERLEND